VRVRARAVPLGRGLVLVGWGSRGVARGPGPPCGGIRGGGWGGVRPRVVLGVGGCSCGGGVEHAVARGVPFALLTDACPDSKEL